MKRFWRCRWQRYRLPDYKRKYYDLNYELKLTISQYDKELFHKFADNLTETNGSLWKATRRILKEHTIKSPLKRNDGYWARADWDKADLLA